MRKFNRSVAVAAMITAGGLTSIASAVPTIDGTRDAEYGSPTAVQTTQTGFGDNQSELNALYTRYDAASGRLNVLLTGNIESNNNKLVLFFDTKAGGQNTLRNDNPDVNFNNLNRRYGQQEIRNNGVPTGMTGPGFTFDTGFDADYFLSFNRNGDNGGTLFGDFAELRTSGGGTGGYLGSLASPNLGTAQGPMGGGSLPSLQVGYNDSNASGVSGGNGAADQTAAAAVTTGFEFSIDVSALDITGDFKLMAFVNGSDHDYVSNQFLPGLTTPQGNLGGDNAGTFISLGTDVDGSDQDSDPDNRGGTVAGVNLNNVAGTQYLTIPITIPTYTYNVDANSNYSNTSAFTPSGTVPTGGNGRVVFGNVITAPRTVTIDQDISLVSLTFDKALGTANAYTLAGTHTITIAGNPSGSAVRVLSGNQLISAPVTLANDTRFDIAAGSTLALTGTFSAGSSFDPNTNTTVSGKNIFKQGAGTLVIPASNANSYTVNAGTLRMTGTGNSIVRGLTIATGATLDLTSSSLIVDYDDGFSPRDAIKANIAAGQFVSSTRSGSKYAIGYLDSAALPALISYNGAPLDSTELVFSATLKGDANLDHAVAFADLVTLAQNYNGTGKDWYQGDFNYDGNVNFQDLVSLAQNYNQSVPSSVIAASFGADFAAEFALAQSLVPEPTSLAAIVAVGGLLSRRRRSIAK